jgi:putative toxin-antitoxin system antitoxin component (TIGR02293 family)
MKNNSFDTDEQGYHSLLSEPSAVYHSSADIISSIRSGISRQRVLEFCRQIGRTLTTLSKVLPASYSLLTKRDMYDAQVGERVMQIAELYRIGIKVFGDVDHLNQWLDTPAPQVHGQRPFDLLDTAYGIDLVKQWIQRIDHGLPA